MNLDELQNLTFIVTIVFVAGIFLYDFYAVLKGGTKATVSYMIIMKWSKQYPAFTFSVGFIMGHLFWPLSTCGG